MKSSRAAVIAVALVVIAVAAWFVLRRGGAEGVDLLTHFEQAKKQGGTFEVVDVTLGNETKKAIAAPPAGRITFHVKVPDDGWLKVSLGMKPESWTTEGNGVHFYAGVSDGRSWEVLFTQTVNPFANPSERRWIPVTVDLSAYAGEEMDIILNTLTSGPGVAPDGRGDMPLWGAPEVVRR